MWSADLVQKRFPWGADANNLKDCRKYLSHAQNCVAIAEELHIENWNIENPRIYGWLFLVGWPIREIALLISESIKNIAPPVRCGSRHIG